MGKQIQIDSLKWHTHICHCLLFYLFMKVILLLVHKVNKNSSAFFARLHTTPSWVKPMMFKYATANKFVCVQPQITLFLGEGHGI